jgi:hypothetical protein
MTTQERDIEIGHLILKLVNAAPVQKSFATATLQAKAALTADPSKLAASIALPLELFGPDLPVALQSCRLSVMRAKTAYHIEKHPNATQYVLSLEHGGTIRVKTSAGWVTSNLSSLPSDPLSARWHTVPADTWHQPCPGENDWTVVAFHTAPANELKDEYDHTV